MRSRHDLRWLLAGLFSLSLAAAQAQVVISQVYGGGGNSGAPLRSDFIELFNAGQSAVDLSGWSVQYASATGSTWQVTPLPNVSLQPGQYLLIKEADGANAAAPALPTPDAVGTIPMAGSGGKVALVDSTLALSGSCPAAIDLVANPLNASCPLAPASKTGPLSNSTAAIRKDGGCANTGDLASDFTIDTPNPRNSASPLAPCAAGGIPRLSVADVSVFEGDAGTVSAAVTISLDRPAPAGGVTFDIASSDGSATAGLDYTALLAVGERIVEGATELVLSISVHGDIDIESDETVLLTLSNVVGADLGDVEGELTIRNDDFAVVPIHDVQGSGRTTPLSLGSQIAVEGIVTARLSNGFFVQSAIGEEDADPATSEGLFVFTGSAPPASAAVGNRVRVHGILTEFAASGQLPLTELSSPTVIALSVGNPLPEPVELTADNAFIAGSLDVLERYEGMRVSVAQLQVVAPSGGNINETQATSTNNGIFYGVPLGVPRPFREPGIPELDPLVPPPGVTPPRFDMNYERIRVRSTGQTGAPQLNADAGDVLTGLVGVLDFGFGAYTLNPDPGAVIQTVQQAQPSAVSVATGDEVTIAGFNLLRFFDTVNDPAIGEPVLTSTAFANRLAKTANAVCAFTRNPDILGVVEVENLDTLRALADAINSQAGNDLFPGSCSQNPQYQAFLIEGNDVGGIDVGFLVKTAEVAAGTPRVEVLALTQVGKNEVFTNPDNTTSLLHDRPPLMLDARVHFADGRSFDVTVIANHLRSLNGVNSTAPGVNGWATQGDRVRAKRAAQALSTATLVESLQQADPSRRIVLVGDFNAFEFSDGLVDTMGIITGREAAAGTVVRFADSPVDVPLTNMAERMPAGDRYSFSFDGNAQSLDHILVNQALLDFAPAARAEHAHINADFGVGNFGNYAVPERVSDHDPVVLFVPVPGLFSVGGTVTGLRGSGLVLQNNLADDLPIDTDGPFTFATRLPNGAAYSVRVATQPTAPAQVCTVTQGAGVLDGTAVTDVRIECRDSVGGPGPTPPAPNQTPTGGVSIVGDLREGASVEARDDIADADGLGPFTYVWRVGGKRLPASGDAHLQIDDEMIGQTLQVEIHYVDGRGFFERVSSPPVGPVRPAGTELAYQKRVFFANPARNRNQQTFLRLVNPNAVFATVELLAFDDAGTPAPGGMLGLQLAPGQALQLNADDLESGNPGKGLSGAFGTGVGKWQIKVNSSAPLRVQSLIRTPGGLLTSVTEVARRSPDGTYELPFAEPALLDVAQSFIRVVNRTDLPGQVEVSAIDDAGQPAPEGTIRFALGPNAARNFNADDFTFGNTEKGLSGHFGQGTGRWRLRISADVRLAVMGLARTPDGFVTNLSAIARVETDDPTADRVLYTLPPAGSEGEGMVRLINPDAQPRNVILAAIDSQGVRGQRLFPVRMDARSALHLSTAQLEHDAWGQGSGPWWVTVIADPSTQSGISVQSLRRTAAGLIANLSGAAPGDSPFTADLWMFNPASNENQRSVLRLVNRAERAGQVMIEAVDDAGLPAPGGSVLVDLAPLAAVELSARDLEQGNQSLGILGALGDGTGKWRLHLSADVPIAAQSLLQASGGFETDLSAVLD